MIMFFHSCVFVSTSTTKLSIHCHDHNLVSTTNPVSRIVILMCLFFVSENKIYDPVNKKSIIAQNKLPKKIDNNIIHANTTPNATNQVFFLL